MKYEIFHIYYTLPTDCHSFQSYNVSSENLFVHQNAISILFCMPVLHIVLLVICFRARSTDSIASVVCSVVRYTVMRPTRVEMNKYARTQCKKRVLSFAKLRKYRDLYLSQCYLLHNLHSLQKVINR